ncbi:hypothetical protein A3Q36_07225 [Geobacillus stearothermophilus]|nr:hypothetical protein A3Q36_07225 [Geobacillus stearothermophilus]
MDDAAAESGGKAGGAGVAVGPPLAAWLMKHGTAPLLLLLSVMALLGGAAAFWLIRPETDEGGVA